MNTLQILVTEFHLKARQPVNTKPTHQTQAIKELRFKLIREELSELCYAMSTDDMVGVADAIGDLLYVVMGTAVSYGIDIDPIVTEIHRSNMTKFIDGKEREDGKWLKGPSYQPPQLKPILDQQSVQPATQAP